MVPPFFASLVPYLGILSFLLGITCFRAVLRICIARWCCHRVPVPRPNTSDTSPVLDRWWSFVARQKNLSATCDAVSTMKSIQALRKAAEAEHFRGKLTGDPPTFLWFGGWQSFGLVLDESEIVCLSSLLFSALWHVVTVVLASSAPLASAQLTFAFNVGDCILMWNGLPNASAARNIRQLLLHHVVSIICIPLMLQTCNLSAVAIFRYQMFLELTGGLSALLQAIQFTPLCTSRLNYVLHLVAMIIFVGMRGPFWILLGLDVVASACASCSSSFVLSCGSCLLAFGGHLLMSWFNYFFLAVWMKRTVQSARGCGLVFLQHSPWRLLHGLIDAIISALKWQDAFVIVLLYLAPLLSRLHWTVGLLSFGAMSWFSWRPFHRGLRSRLRVTLSNVDRIMEVLQHPAFSPTPHRYIEPSPLVSPFASWVRSMLLYSSVGDHTRLKQTYPPLNDPVYVREQLGDCISESVMSLLLPLRGSKSRFEFMEMIAHKLPWLVMQRVAGIPRKDVGMASSLIRTLGDFVGKPFSPETLKPAMEAHLQMLKLIDDWKTNALDGAIRYWMQTFKTVELEANVVMLLFAGTHNLENVLGHAVRLLLQNPEQLDKLREDRSLINSVVEETLRICPPIQIMPRTALETVRMSWGHTFGVGETVLLDVVAANRECSQPSEFLLERPDRRQLAFGFGPHVCNGSALGRLQVKELVTELLLNQVVGEVDIQDCVSDASNTYSTLTKLQLRVVKKPDFVSIFGNISPTLIRLLQSDELSVNVCKEPSKNVVEYCFVAVSSLEEAQNGTSLLKIREIVGRDCFKVFFLNGNVSRMDAFELLKNARFNLGVFGSTQVVTPECGLIFLKDEREMLEFIVKRKNVRWFETLQAADSPAVDDAIPSCGSLLTVAQEASLFGGALDVTSGNISHRSQRNLPSFWVTPRQVDKSCLSLRDMVLVWTHSSRDRKLCCSVPKHLDNVKSSIDSGVLSRLYEAWLHCECILHFHYGGVKVTHVDAVTRFPYPCGSLEEALEIMHVAELQRAPFLVELIEHGYLLVLEKEGAQRTLDTWRNVLLQSSKTHDKLWKNEGSEVLPSLPRNRPFPVFHGALIVGATVIDKHGDRLTWYLNDQT